MNNSGQLKSLESKRKGLAKNPPRVWALSTTVYELIPELITWSRWSIRGCPLISSFDCSTNSCNKTRRFIQLLSNLTQWSIRRRLALHPSFRTQGIHLENWTFGTFGATFNLRYWESRMTSKSVRYMIRMLLIKGKLHDCQPVSK